MNTKKNFPSWMIKGSKWMQPKDTITEEERLEKLRNEYAEVIKDLFPRNNQKYHEEMMDEINEDLEYKKLIKSNKEVNKDWGSLSILSTISKKDKLIDEYIILT